MAPPATNADAAFVTPVRRPRGSHGSNNSTNRRRSSQQPVDSELSPNGAQMLHDGLRPSGRPITMQVLGIYRYVADPALRRVLPSRALVDLHRDVFDVLLSDGQRQLKAVLSPTLNDLVWRGVLTDLDVVEIDDYEHVRDTARQATVCVVHELTVRRPPSPSNDDATAPSMATNGRSKIVYTTASNAYSPDVSNGSVGTEPVLQFVTKSHIRDHGALPVAGERLYYLSLLSDDCPFGWDIPGASDPLTPVDTVLPWAQWNRRRRYCTDVFSGSDRVVYTIRDANLATSKRKRAQGESDDEYEVPKPPPMIGIVMYKSALTHLGTPEIANDYPFMFQIVLSDFNRSVEMAFFGSMAAKNFLLIDEGDVIRVQDYTVGRSEARFEGDKSRKLFYLPHRSNGVVSHVPEKFWHLLEMMEVLPMRPAGQEVISNGDTTEHKSKPRANPSTVWFEPDYVTTLQTQQWTPPARAEPHFDFVGIVAYVGRIHRRRQPESDTTSVSTVTAYRWIQVFDSSSSTQVAVRVYIHSNPVAFHAIQAGDVVMLTRLEWKHTPELSFASTTLFTLMRLNNAVKPFSIFKECAEAFTLASELLDIKTQYSTTDMKLVVTTESWLEGPSVIGFVPSRQRLTMNDSVVNALSALAQDPSADDCSSHWIPHFYPSMSLPMTEISVGMGYNYPFDQVGEVAESMDAMSHRYLRVHVALHDVRIAVVDSTGSTGEVELLVSDGNGQSRQPPQPLRVRPNMLFSDPQLPKPLDTMVSPEAELVVRTLPPAAIKALHTVAMLRATELPQFSPAKAKLSSPGVVPVANTGSVDEGSGITLEVVKDFMLKHRDRHGDIDVALHLYRLPHGDIDLWVDAINIYSIGSM